MAMDQALMASPFRVPPEVPRYFADKSLKPAFSWLDVWAEEHAYSFTVAKAIDAELLATLKASIQRAIEQGQGFEDWRRELRPELERLGWARPRRVADPTGREPDRVVNFTAPGRLQTIFSANMRSARAAGQWERIQRSKGALPYLLYVRTTSARPRPQHLAWAGTILPADDPWWSTHFPPNGWRCKCAVRQVSRGEREELLGQDGYSDDSPPLLERTFRNRRTGELTRVPDGIDPGWANNPGLSRARTLMQNLGAKIEEAGPEAAKRTISQIWQSNVPAVMAAVRHERLQLPVAYAPRIQARLGSIGPMISVSNETVRRKTIEKADPRSRAEFRLAQSLAEQGALVDKGAQGLWALGNIAGQRWRMALKRSADGYAYVATLGPIRGGQVRGLQIPDIEEE